MEGIIRKKPRKSCSMRGEHCKSGGTRQSELLKKRLQPSWPAVQQDIGMQLAGV